MYRPFVKYTLKIGGLEKELGELVPEKKKFDLCLYGNYCDLIFVFGATAPSKADFGLLFRRSFCDTIRSATAKSAIQCSITLYDGKVVWTMLHNFRRVLDVNRLADAFSAFYTAGKERWKPWRNTPCQSVSDPCCITICFIRNRMAIMNRSILC